MSRRELERLEVVQRVAGRRIKQGDAAYMLGLSVRQVKRLLGAYRQDGAAGFGRASVGASDPFGASRRRRRRVFLPSSSRSTPTSAQRRAQSAIAVLLRERGRGKHLCGRIVVTPSHNPPRDGGFKDNQPACEVVLAPPRADPGGPVRGSQSIPRDTSWSPWSWATCLTRRVPACLIPDDHIDKRPFPLFLARDVLSGLIRQWSAGSEGGRATC